MTAIHSRNNPYPGINAHMHSFMQARDGGWSSFHNVHIVHLFEAIGQKLPPPYVAVPEKSLQIATYDPDDTLVSSKAETTVPDVGIYKLRNAPFQRQPQPESSDLSAPTLLLPIHEQLDDEEDITSVVIYRLQRGKYPGIPVMRIELLSPANKPPGSHFKSYMEKRTETLYSGLRVVELDYLHETRPILPGIPSYIDAEENAYPHSIIVTDPRPSVAEGKTEVYGFALMQPLPRIQLPLEQQDAFTLDFGEVYQRTINSLTFLHPVIDYSQAPERFDAYAPADQERIRTLMAQIAAEQVEHRGEA